MPPTPPQHKTVSFCSHCKYNEDTYNSDHDIRYYSDPGREDQPKPKAKKDQLYSTDSDQRYYSEPDVKYFEIDYEFLKELRRIARHNCQKCRRKRSRGKERIRRSVEKDKDKPKYEKTQEIPEYAKTKSKPVRSVRMKENYVFCNGRYHSDKEHCQLCCRICNRSTDTLDSIDDEYSLVSKSYSSSKATLSSRSKSTPPKSSQSKSSISSTRDRKNSIQSIKSVSFLESSNEEKDETHYTAKSFTNDLKKFLLKPATPRLSFRDKFINSFKQEIEATKKSPKLKAIKGLWKSY